MSSVFVQASGFDGVEQELRDSQEDDLHTQSLFVTRVSGQDGQTTPASFDVAITTPFTAHPRQLDCLA